MSHTRVTVGAIVQNKEGRLLLAQRAHEPFNGTWCIPGGHVEFGEHPDDAVVREVKEETGIDITSFEFFRFFHEYYEHMQWHAVALIYSAEGSGTLSPQEGEVSQLEFVNPEEALERDLAFNHREIIQQYFFR